MLGTLADLFGNANGQTPLIVLIAGVALLAAAWIGRRAFASQARQGRRIGTVTKLVNAEQLRRRQLEQCLRESGIRLPYWPGDPVELYAAYSGPGPWPEDGVPLPRGPVDPEPATAAHYLTSDERADVLARHRRRNP